MTKLLQGTHRALALLAMVLLVSACATRGDYGDAPDGRPTGYPAAFAQTGNFPTLAASNGAATRDVSQAILGPSASVENDANDPADPDGQPNLNRSAASFCRRRIATLAPPVSITSTSSDAPTIST